MTNYFVKFNAKLAKRNARRAGEFVNEYENMIHIIGIVGSVQRPVSAARRFRRRLRGSEPPRLISWGVIATDFRSPRYCAQIVLSLLHTKELR
ncbi:jg3613 [Pararge aegeria aegeria]|uniref:Jg3613 protein n=1 Tax=Pararge aegeria aegeria TaxID=348720 RepID=A0A8S4QX11_9NEOP|nr:jg3613 [Pararge aegeria aegeria]